MQINWHRHAYDFKKNWGLWIFVMLLDGTTTKSNPWMFCYEVKIKMHYLKIQNNPLKI